MKTLVFIVAILTFALLNAQENPLAMNGYIGYQQSQLHLGLKDYKQVGTCSGLDTQFGGMSWNFLRGTVRPETADSTVGSNSFFIFKVGYRLAKDLRVGNNSFTSFGVKPFVHVFGSYASMPNKPLNNGKMGSAGLVLSPGVEFKFSHAYFVARYDAGLYANTAFWGGNRAHNLARGFVGGLTFTVGVDNAFDLLSPKQFSLNGYNVAKKTWSESNVKYDIQKNERYLEVVNYVHTTYTPGQRSLLLVAPFWGIGPSYSFMPTLVDQDPTQMFGVNLGTRFWLLMADAFYEEGQMGMKSPVSYKETIMAYPILRDYTFASSVSAKRYGGRLGVNILKEIVMKMNFQSDKNDKKAARWKTSYMRFNVYYTLGKLELTSPVSFRMTDAENRIQTVLNQKGELSTSKNNPSLLATNQMFKGWGANLEIGSVFFNWTSYRFEDEAANHVVYTVGANIPLGRLIRSQKIRYKNF